MIRIITNNVGSEGLNNLRNLINPAIASITRQIGGNNTLKPTMASSNPGAQIFGRTDGRLFMSWGSSQAIPTGNAPILNKPTAIGLATHKLRFFQHIDAWNSSPDNEENQVTTVPWTTDRDIVNNWLSDAPVYARTVLQGHSGEGIVVVNRGDEVPRASLYTKGISGARREYRIHVIGGKVSLVQLKKRRSGAGTATGEADTVRNLGSGWVYAVSDANPSRLVLNQALNTVKALGLDFGAVDIIAKGRKGRENSCYVLEVNTAPGQRGDSTVKVYARAIVAAHIDFMRHPREWNAETSSTRLAALDFNNPAWLQVWMSEAGVRQEIIDTLVGEEIDDDAIPPAPDDAGDDAAPDTNFALEGDNQPVRDLAAEAHAAIDGARRAVNRPATAEPATVGIDWDAMAATVAPTLRGTPPPMPPVQPAQGMVGFDPRRPLEGLNNGQVWSMIHALEEIGFVIPRVDERLRTTSTEQILRTFLPNHVVEQALNAQRTPPRRGGDVPAVELPQRIAPASRLGNADPRNEQFVMFRFNNRVEVGVVNTQRGAVYMAGSDMPIPVASVELLATVGALPN